MRAVTGSVDRTSTLTVAGDLDVRTGPALVAAAAAILDESATRSLVLDLVAVGLVDAAGIAALLAAHRLARAAGTTLHLQGMRPRVSFVLELTGTSAILAPTTLAA